MYVEPQAQWIPGHAHGPLTLDGHQNKKLTARLFGAVNYVWMAIVIPMIRPVMIAHAILVVVASALWIASIHVHEPSRQALIWLAIAFGGSSVPATFPGMTRDGLPDRLTD